MIIGKLIIKDWDDVYDLLFRWGAREKPWHDREYHVGFLDGKGEGRVFASAEGVYNFWLNNNKRPIEVVIIKR